MRSVLTVVVGALALMATGPAAVGPSPAAGTPRSAAAGGQAHTPRASTPRSAGAVAREVVATDQGTFRAVYDVGPPAGHSTPTEVVTVAQRAGSGHVAWPYYRGEWMYRSVSSTGSMLEWVETGSRATWCQRLRRSSPITCGGPVTWVASNGFADMMATFIPGVAASGLKSLLTQYSPAQLDETVHAAPSRGAGVQCLTLSPALAGSARWCVAGRRLVSVNDLTGPFANGPARLASWSPRAPASAFAEPAGCPARCRRSSYLPGV